MVGFGKADENDEKQRLIRRMQHCAQAREETIQLLSVRFAQREATKSSMQRDTEVYKDALAYQKRLSSDRWGVRLHRSPYLNDLGNEYEKRYEELELKKLINDRKRKQMKYRDEKARDAIFKRALDEKNDLDILRSEKRILMQQEKKLKAIRDAEKTKARTSKIENEKRAKQLERQRLQNNDIEIQVEVEYDGTVEQEMSESLQKQASFSNKENVDITKKRVDIERQHSSIATIATRSPLANMANKLRAAIVKNKAGIQYFDNYDQVPMDWRGDF